MNNFYNKEYVNKLSKQTIYKIKRLLKYINFNESDFIADYGCGDGKLACLIHKKVSKYIGIDFSKDFIELAKTNVKEKKLKNVYFKCEDIIEFSKKNQNMFDKAFSLDFTEHIYDEEFLNIFKSIKQTIKKNGELYIHTPNGNYFLEILKKKGIIKQLSEHIAVRNNKENIKLLRQVGFKNINLMYISHYHPLLKIFHFLSYLPFIGKYFKARLFIICKK